MPDFVDNPETRSSRGRSLALRVMVLGALLFGMLGAAGYVGYWAAQREIIRKVMERYIEPRLPDRKLADTQTAEWRTVETNLHTLQIAQIPMTNVDAPVWALASAGDNLVFSTRLGQLSYMDAAHRLWSLDLRVPMRMDALAKSGFYDDPVFQLDQVRTTDLLIAPAGPNRFDLYASHHRYADKCFQMVVSRTTLEQTKGGGLRATTPKWDTVFVSRNCIKFKARGMRFAGHEGGGRLVMTDPDTLLLSTGTFQFDGIDDDFQAGQDDETDMGKIIEIKLSTGKARTYAKGLRNPQGLLVARDGRVWETEHGPRGGDEVNLIRENGNYGWPVVTYGTEYGAPGTPWRFNPTRNAHDGYDKPKYAFVPSVGTSNLAEPDTKEFPLWNRHLLVESLYGNTLFLLFVDGEDIAYAEPIRFGAERLRDIAITSDGKIAMVSDSGMLIFVRNAARYPETDRTLTVTGLTRLPPMSPEEAASIRADNVGARTFQYQCGSCHSIEGQVGIGPPLNGVVGRKIGSVEGFGYSPALKEHGGNWTKGKLKSFINDPQRDFEGSVMPGKPMEGHIMGALLRYLESTKAGPPPPSAKP